MAEYDRRLLLGVILFALGTVASGLDILYLPPPLSAYLPFFPVPLSPFDAASSPIYLRNTPFPRVLLPS